MLIFPQTPLLNQYDNWKLKVKTIQAEKQTDMKITDNQCWKTIKNTKKNINIKWSF